jgi:Reverse transcriptase (RNA-dependent DNA polymerase)
MCRYGDTDVFPHLPEFAFISECEQEVVDELAKLDLDAHVPGGALEALAPKSRYGFRIAHQLSATDNLLLLASVVELAREIEKLRLPKEGIEAFAYRFEIGPKGQIFHPQRTFRDWLNAQQKLLKNDVKIASVVATDISDFYARINFHRIENLLDDCAPASGAARFVKKHIRAIRAKQSFGLPVGGSAARLLAELALVDTDRSLLDQGFVFTRFVDDFRIFLGANEDPYAALGFLAEQLGINEGLSLNVAKTEVRDKASYSAWLDKMTTDVSEQAEGIALDTLTSNIYFDEDPDEEDIEKLKTVNLLGFLDEEIAADQWDVGRIRIIFRALKITKPPEAIPYIVGNFKHFVVFAKELCLLMQALESDELGCFDDLLDDVIEASLRPPAASVQVIRTWLLEIFVRGTISIPATKLKRLEALPSALDKRQLFLIGGRQKAVNFFRMQKTAFDQFTPFERPCLIWGASCLPRDEFEKWINTVQSTFKGPTNAIFLKWVSKSKGALFAKLGTNLDEHH